VRGGGKKEMVFCEDGLGQPGQLQSLGVKRAPVYGSSIKTTWIRLVGK